MKTKVILTSLTLIAILSLFTTCKKYPEGGIQSKGPKNIIGSWLLILYEVDGIDSTNLINYNGNEDYKKVTITTPSSSSKEIHIHPLGGTVYNITFSTNNTTFDGVVDNVYYGAWPCFPDGCHKQYFTPETKSASWKILKLDSKELHLQSQQIHSYNLKFIKIN